MKHLYFIKSSRRNECSIITVFTDSVKRAIAIAQINFIKHGYKGYPKLAV